MVGVAEEEGAIMESVVGAFEGQHFLARRLPLTDQVHEPAHDGDRQQRAVEGGEGAAPEGPLDVEQACQIGTLRGEDPFPLFFFFKGQHH